MLSSALRACSGQNSGSSPRGTEVVLRAETGRGPEFTKPVRAFHERADRSHAPLLERPAERTEHIFGGLVLLDKCVHAGLHRSNVLNGAHFSLIGSQFAQLPVAKSNDAGRQRLHHVSEFLEGHTRSMNCVRISHVNHPASAQGLSVSFARSV